MSINSGKLDDLARALFIKENPSGIWAAEDYGTQLHYRLEAEKMDQWQPIATAPQNARILGSDGRKVAITIFETEWFESRWEDESKVESDGYGWYGHGQWTPTHWMPLPLPPSS